MQITQHPSVDHLELELCGRLDANWAEHVGSVIENAVRAGNHRIHLNFARVDYVSSAGIRVLVKHFKQLKAVDGILRIVQPSQSALSIIKLAGLESLLIAPAAAPAQATNEAKTSLRKMEADGVVFELYEQNRGAILSGSLLGQPEKFSNGGFSEADCQRVSFPSETLGLGLGAFGTDFADCRNRFGEFLAVGGAALALPTDGSSVPDYVLAEAQLVPEVNVLYAWKASGGFANLLRFEPKPEKANVVGLGELIQAALHVLEMDKGGFVILAESAAVVGATLRRSPTAGGGSSPLAFPGVRDWLSFTTERSNERNLILIVGMAERNPAPTTASFLRPIGASPDTQGHFHAAVFPYRPLQKGNLDLGQSISKLLSTDSAQTVMHLLADDRQFEGVGQTELMRGACWVSPIPL